MLVRNNRYIEKFNTNKQHAPRPSVGDCTNTGNWSDISMVDDCTKCVGTPGYYGETQFYCGGKCMSEYDTAQHCSSGSLVAKTVGQCAAPCMQSGSPALRGCSDDFDCKNGFTCENNNCVPGPKENFDASGFENPNFIGQGDYDYSLNMSSYVNTSYFTDKDKKGFIGVL